MKGPFFLLILKGIYKDLHWVHSVAGNLNGRFHFLEFINPVVALENMLVVHLASESTAGFYVAVGSLPAGRVFPKVFPVLCIFTDTAENGAGIASESPSVLYVVTRMFKNCWLCSLNTHCTAAVSSYPTFFF